ncbi:MAG: hypothetical protein AB1401_03830 [Thermodesulfobacteriota bacterium]
MSLINRNNLSYLYCVEQYFLSLTKIGTALSPLDYQIIKSWEKRGVPLNVACNAVKIGIESFKKTSGLNKPLPKSIKYCKNLVEEEFINYKRRKVGTHFKRSGELEEKIVLFKKINVLIDKIARITDIEKDEKVRKLYAVVYDRILRLSSNIDENYLFIYTEVERIDKYLIDEFLKLISPDDVTTLMGEAEEKLSLHKIKMSQEAYERTFISLRNLLVRERYGLLKIEIGD